MPEQVVKVLLDNGVGQFMSSFTQQGMRAVEWKHIGPATKKHGGVEYPGDSWRLQIDSADHKAYATFILSVYYGWLGREDAGYFDSAKAAGMDSHGDVNMTIFLGDMDERDKRHKENERRRVGAAHANGLLNFGYLPYNLRDIGSLTWQFTLKKKGIKGYQRWFQTMARAVIVPLGNKRDEKGEPMLDHGELETATRSWASERH